MRFPLRITTQRFGRLVSVVVFLLFNPAWDLTGRVIEGSGKGVGGALVQLVRAGDSTLTDAHGNWAISLLAGLKGKGAVKSDPAIALRGNWLYVNVTHDQTDIGVSIYSPDGGRIYAFVQGKLSVGEYNLNPAFHKVNPGIYLLRVTTGVETAYFKWAFLGSRMPLRAFLRRAGAESHTAKTAAAADTVKVSKPGYLTAAMPISSYNIGPLTIELIPEQKPGPFYYRPPPDPCTNQFFAEGCVWDSAASACGGVCAVANACSPPESATKSHLAKTFLCPRFLLFSREMIQAAKDDTKLYKWGNDEEPPFHYAIVGHDADEGGLDDKSSSCCQCYQLIFETPEPSSPKPPELPYPKSLVVQSFNTAASGPKGFDVFMGAGGYGAFNACYDDKSFPNTTKFDSFIYDAYPHQNPNSGGISFLRYEAECRPSWPPKLTDLRSSACQDKIKEQCNQALVNASSAITEDTRQSCILSNKAASLYHQNWTVRAKRVRCPENLTRVTGCRLKEDNLPLPAPSVQTPAQADGAFKQGYHTTTMQDCCKPSCAWSDWVGKKGLPVDGEWNSFYSCDENGTVLAK